VLEFHKRQIELFKTKLGLSNYTLLWMAFFKGILIGYLLACYL